MSVAAYAVVGEKQARTLEPLLATPITTFELLAAKVLGALVPGIVLAITCFALYLGGIVLFAHPGVYRTLFFPRALLTIFLLGPLKHPRDALVSAEAIAARWKELNVAGAPSRPKAVEEYDAFIEILQASGAQIDFLPPDERVNLDSIYVRDASVVCARGVILC